LEFRQLSHFVAVAEEQSFTRAARRMHIVQSGISASIAALERELGTPLFRRSRHHVELTEAGRALLTGARRALAAVADAQAAVRHTSGSLTGTLSIGVIQAMPPRFRVSSLLRDFHLAYPGVYVEVKRLATPLFEELRSGELDIAIGPGYPHEGINAISLGRYPLVLAVRESDPLAKRAHVTLAQAAEHPQIAMPANWLLRPLIQRAYQEAGITPHAVAESNDFVLLLGMVAAGLGVAILPDVVARFGPSVRFVPFKPPIADWPAAMMYLGDEPAKPAARAFLEMFTSRRAEYAP